MNYAEVGVEYEQIAIYADRKGFLSEECILDDIETIKHPGKYRTLDLSIGNRLYIGSYTCKFQYNYETQVEFNNNSTTTSRDQSTENIRPNISISRQILTHYSPHTQHQTLTFIFSCTLSLGLSCTS